MKKCLFSLALALLLVVVFAGGAMAQTTDTNDLNVTASVTASCRITSVTDIAFGAYDPTDPTDNTVGAGDIRFRCVKGTAYSTYIVGTRTMTSSGADVLNFEIYSDAIRTAAFPAVTGTGGTAASNTEITTNVYGRITALQDVGVDNYSRTLTATVEY